MFSIQIMATFKAIKSHLKQSYDKQNLKVMVISNEFMKLAKDSFHKCLMKLPLQRVRSSISVKVQSIGMDKSE